MQLLSLYTAERLVYKIIILRLLNTPAATIQQDCPNFSHCAIYSRTAALIQSNPPVSYDHVMLWAACCVGFFGFLRAGEFTCAPSDITDPPLCSDDVSVDSRADPQLVTLHLRQSKTDPFGVGCFIYLGRTNTNPCPVAAVLNYLSVRPSTPGPLFVFDNGSPLTWLTTCGSLYDKLG